jgi:hypothetical protein
VCYVLLRLTTNNNYSLVGTALHPRN